MSKLDAEIVVTTTALLPSGAAYADLVSHWPVTLTGTENITAGDQRTLDLCASTFRLPTGHRVVVSGVSVPLCNLANGTVELATAPIVLRDDQQPIVVNVEPTPIEITNLIEAPNKVISLERDRRGQLKSATVEDAA